MNESQVTDPASRLIYADWLDENGEPEAADRQRKRAQLSFVLQQIAAGWFDAELDHIEQVIRARREVRAAEVRDAMIRLGARCTVFSQRIRQRVEGRITVIDGNMITVEASYTYRGNRRSAEITVPRSGVSVYVSQE